jgi:hypothetical protein
MRDSQSLKSDIAYAGYLIGAVLEGFNEAPKPANGRAFTPVLTSAIWPPMAIGAAIGLLSASLSRGNKPAYRVAVGGLLGSAVGFGAGIAWTSRDYTGAVARSTIQKVNTVRDARWLEKNPIAYA